MNSFVLCFHPEGDAHVELMGKNASEANADCLGSEIPIVGSDCLSCTDLVLESTDLGPTRAQELSSVHVPTPLISSSPKQLPVMPLLMGLQVAVLYPEKEQPEAASEMISRIVVLRL